MTTEQLAINSAISSWKLIVGRADRVFSNLSEEQLFTEVAPGRNRSIYIWGHVTAVHDGLLKILGLGERLHPELDAIFVTSPDKASVDVPTGAVLKTYWDEINKRLLEEFNRLPPEEWLMRHMSVSDEDFAKDPLRNRLSVLLSRTNHTSFHLGQTVLAPRVG
jgi:hypothetical protein